MIFTLILNFVLALLALAGIGCVAGIAFFALTLIFDKRR